MVAFMNQQSKYRRIVSVLLTLLLLAALIIPTTVSVSAANTRFITELRVEAGEEAVDTLEADGWSVTMVGLNVSADSDAQVYLGYKMNTGSPITNVIVSPDVGDSFTDENGIVYNCVSHVDADAGYEGGNAGCLYATHDERAGSALVGIDVIRGNDTDDEVLYPITNDGAEIVRTPQGTPADLEPTSETDVVYLAQIRDGIVRPYISEIGVVTDTDKWNAIYTACERGYNYYVDGDIDDAADTYTIIAFERTADPEQAVTGVTAVSAQTAQSLEDSQIVDAPNGQSGNVSAAAVTISGAEYVRISGQPINGETPYYIYRSKDKNAGNPITMLYAQVQELRENVLLGTWANSYFFTPGVTTAYTYGMNEDIFTSLWEDQTVCTMLPVQLLESIGSTPSETLPPATADEAQPQQEDNNASANKSIKLAVLTPRDGLPALATGLTGMRGDPAAPYFERTQRSDRVSKFQASVFGSRSAFVLIPSGIAIIIAAVVIILKKRSAKKDSEKSKKNRPNQANKSKKSKKSMKAR